MTYYELGSVKFYFHQFLKATCVLIYAVQCTHSWYSKSLLTTKDRNIQEKEGKTEKNEKKKHKHFKLLSNVSLACDM